MAKNKLYGIQLIGLAICQHTACVVRRSHSVLRFHCMQISGNDKQVGCVRLSARGVVPAGVRSPITTTVRRDGLVTFDLGWVTRTVKVTRRLD